MVTKRVSERRAVKDARSPSLVAESRPQECRFANTIAGPPTQNRQASSAAVDICNGNQSHSAILNPAIANRNPESTISDQQSSIMQSSQLAIAERSRLGAGDEGFRDRAGRALGCRIARALVDGDEHDVAGRLEVRAVPCGRRSRPS